MIWPQTPSRWASGFRVWSMETLPRGLSGSDCLHHNITVFLPFPHLQLLSHACGGRSPGPRAGGWCPPQCSSVRALTERVLSYSCVFQSFLRQETGLGSEDAPFVLGARTAFLGPLPAHLPRREAGLWEARGPLRAPGKRVRERKPALLFASSSGVLF